jgi:hypothetical protein
MFQHFPSHFANLSAGSLQSDSCAFVVQFLKLLNVRIREGLQNSEEYNVKVESWNQR